MRSNPTWFDGGFAVCFAHYIHIPEANILISMSICSIFQQQTYNNSGSFKYRFILILLLLEAFYLYNYVTYVDLLNNDSSLPDMHVDFDTRLTADDLRSKSPCTDVLNLLYFYNKRHYLLFCTPIRHSKITLFLRTDIGRYGPIGGRDVAF